MNNHFVAIIIALFMGGALSAQSITDFVNKGLEQNDIAQKLPPLDSLIDIAKENSPRLKFFDADYEYWRGQITLAKRPWLSNIYLEANYGYGVFDNLSNEQIAGAPTASQTLFSTEQDRYTLGASIKMPLSSIFNTNREVKNAKAEAEKSKYQKEYAIWEIEQLVAKQYNDLIKAHRLFFISGSIVETYKVQSIRAEKDFANGIINVAEYTRLQQMLNQAIKTFESERSDFIIAMMALETTVGVDLNF